MKTKRNLLEVGIVLFIFGMSMIVFPSIFETASVHQQTEEDGLILGTLLIAVGLILISIKWYIIKKNQ